MFTRRISIKPDDFSDWLRSYFFELIQQGFPEEAHRAKKYAGRIELDHIPRWSKFKKRRYKGVVRGISYCLDRVSETEIEVIFGCKWPAVKTYFDKLIAEIDRRWPEAKAETGRQPHPEIKYRREQVKKLWQSGRSDFEIANILTCSEKTVQRDRKKLGLKAR